MKRLSIKVGEKGEEAVIDDENKEEKPLPLDYVAQHDILT